jgi:hypothetical protein
MIDHSREQLRDFEHIVAKPSIALEEKYLSGPVCIIFGCEPLPRRGEQRCTVQSA